jgi:D-amino-acid oxidase
MSGSIMSRRGIVQGLAATGAVLGASVQKARALRTSTEFANGKFETRPNFDMTPLRRVAGLRPHRDGTYLLKRQDYGSKAVFHNYGHGGGGITMSWGCAQEIADLIKASRLLDTEKKIAVIGAGVMGLTAATTLLQLAQNVSIRIFAAAYYPDTTSSVAGGQWSPTSVEFNDEDQYRRILNRSFMSYASRVGKGFGINHRTNYSVHRIQNFDFVSRKLIPEPVAFDHLPFQNMRASGFSYQTLLVEPLIFLKRLHNDLAASKRVQFINKKFSGSDEILALPEKIIVNCTGLAAGKLWGDPNVKPVKGQLIILPPQPLKYLFSGEPCERWDQYMFPRADGLVIGGTYQTSFASPDENEHTCNELLSRIRGFFNGEATCHPEPAPV